MAFVKRKKIRLEGYDYSSCGAYFITIVWQTGTGYYGKTQKRTTIASELKPTRMNRLYYRAPEPSLRTKFKN